MFRGGRGHLSLQSSLSPWTLLFSLSLSPSFPLKRMLSLGECANSVTGSLPKYLQWSELGQDEAWNTIQVFQMSDTAALVEGWIQKLQLEPRYCDVGCRHLSCWAECQPHAGAPCMRTFSLLGEECRQHLLCDPWCGFK